MALKNSQYYALMREYEQTRLKNHDLQMKRYEEVYKKLPEFKSLDESISILSVQYGKKMLNGDPKALSSLKEELAILRQNKKEPSYFCRISQRLSGTDLRLSRLHGHRIYRKRKMSLFQNAPFIELLYEPVQYQRNFRQKHLFDYFDL